MQAVSEDEIKKLRALSDKAFDLSFAHEVQLEAKQSMRVVYFISEADRRKHWLAEFSTLANYCAKHGISNSDFYRKLSVLHTMRELPEIEAKIINGTLNPTTVSQVNTFCRMEAKLRASRVSRDEKRELLIAIEGKSQSAVERKLAQLSPQSATADKKRQISETLFSNHYTSDLGLERKLTRLKELLSNSLPPNPTQNELLHRICDIALSEVDPVKKEEKAEKRRLAREKRKQNTPRDVVTPALVINCVNDLVGKLASAEDDKARSQSLAKPNLKKSRAFGIKIKRPAISTKTKRLIRLRDQNQCAVIYSKTGKRCEMRTRLEFDHVISYAKGGDDSPENLRQVCRNHNQWLALREFGRKKMARYVPALE